MPLIRRICRGRTIVVGGHIANIPDCAADRRGLYRQGGRGALVPQYLGEDPDRPIRHPQSVSGIGTRNSASLADKPGDVAATVIPSVGCPMGCNFCSTSAMFGGKGKFGQLLSDRRRAV